MLIDHDHGDIFNRGGAATCPATCLVHRCQRRRRREALHAPRTSTASSTSEVFPNQHPRVRLQRKAPPASAAWRWCCCALWYCEEVVRLSAISRVSRARAVGDERSLVCGAGCHRQLQWRCLRGRTRPRNAARTSHHHGDRAVGNRVVRAPAGTLKREKGKSFTSCSVERAPQHEQLFVELVWTTFGCDYPV